VPKVQGCRLVLLSTAGDPSHPSHKLLAQAKASDQWRVSETPGPCPLIALEAIAEQRRLLPESQYRRLHLNQWTEAEDRLVSAEAQCDAVVLDGPQEPRVGVRYVIGLDVGLKHDATACATAHAETDAGATRVVLDRMLTWQGTRLHPVKLDDIERAVLEASRRYSNASVRCDPWQAAGLGQRLSRQGVRVDEYAFGPQSVGRLASRTCSSKTGASRCTTTRNSSTSSRTSGCARRALACCAWTTTPIGTTTVPSRSRSPRSRSSNVPPRPGRGRVSPATRSRGGTSPASCTGVRAARKPCAWRSGG
jgi:hypothetical protein